MNDKRKILWSSTCLFLLQAFVLVQSASAADIHDLQDSEQHEHSCTLCLLAAYKLEKSGGDEFDDGSHDAGDPGALFQSFESQAQPETRISFRGSWLGLDGQDWKSCTPRAPPV